MSHRVLLLVLFDNMSENSLSPSPSLLVDDSHGDRDMELHLSLQETMKHPSCVNPAWMDTIADLKNNPRVLPNLSHNDGCLHWVDKNNEILCLAFPAVLDVYGKYGRIGPYFSLVGNQVCLTHNILYQSYSLLHQKPTIPNLTKIKAVFQLSPLTLLAARDVPQEAIECSARAMNVIQTLCGNVENKKNERAFFFFFLITHPTTSVVLDLHPSKYASCTPFHRTDVDTNEFKFVVHTAPLFQNLPNPNNLSVRTMSLSDLKTSSK